MERGWEYNDEFNYPIGESLRSKLFLDEATADAECQRLCGEFFAAETPDEFGVDFEGFHLAGRDPVTVTWEDLRATGFPDPFSVQLVQTAEDFSRHEHPASILNAPPANGAKLLTAT